MMLHGGGCQVLVTCIVLRVSSAALVSRELKGAWGICSHNFYAAES